MDTTYSPSSYRIVEEISEYSGKLQYRVMETREGLDYPLGAFYDRTEAERELARFNRTLAN